MWGEVDSSLPEKSRGVAEVPKPPIATVTKDASYIANLVAVVDMVIAKLLSKFVTTNRTGVVLLPKELLFHFWC